MGSFVPQVLIVDGDPRSRASAVDQARRGGHHAVEIGSPTELVGAVDLEAIDAVVIDLEQAARDGFAACAQLRGLPGGATTPIIFVTDRDDPALIDAAVAAGADDVLVRPLRANELAVRVRALRHGYARRRVEHALLVDAQREREAQARLSAQKDALTEFLVHDLKSPIASVTMALQELVLVCDSPLGRDAARACLATTETVGRMVMNLLDVSCGHALPVRRSACSVGALFRHLRDHFAPRLEIREVTLATRADAIELWADAELLRRVAENLVDNALRYAPPRTHVDVAVEATDGGTALVVTDRGPGVPVVHRERVFDRFVQLDPDAGRRASRGLGLAFCRLALEAHAGRIWVDEPPGGGARFCALFPDPEAPPC